MNWSVDQPETPSAAVSFAEFGSDEQTVLRIMANKGAPMAIDELTLKTNLSPGQLASLLLQLEFQQVIRALPGKLFTLAR